MILIKKKNENLYDYNLFHIIVMYCTAATLHYNTLLSGNILLFFFILFQVVSQLANFTSEVGK